MTVLHLASLRSRLFLIVAAAVTPFVLYAVLTAAREKTFADSTARAQSLARARAAARVMDSRLLAVDRLLDSAMVRVRRAGGAGAELKLQDAGDRVLNGALTIAVITPGGARTGVLMGSATRIDSIPVDRRIALVGAAMASLRQRTGGAPATFVDEGGARTANDSIAMIIVRPLPRMSANCNCLADTPGAVVAALSDKTVQGLLGADSLPTSGVAVLIGSAGIPLGRIATPARWISSDSPDTSVVATRVSREGDLNVTGQDGVTRAVGFAALTQLPWRVYVGVSSADRQGLSDQKLRDAFLLCVLALAIAGVGAVVASRGFSAPLQTLVADTKRLAAGTLSHRSAVAAAPGEIGALGAAINSLASDLEVQRATLKDEVRRAMVLFEESPVAMWVADAAMFTATSGRITQVNAAAARLFGVAPSALIGQRDKDLVDPAGATLLVSAPVIATEPELLPRTGRATLRSRDTNPPQCTMTVRLIGSGASAIRVVALLPVTAPAAVPVVPSPTVTPPTAASPAPLPVDDAALVRFAGQIAEELHALLNGLSGFTKLALDSADDPDMRTIALERIHDLSAEGLSIARQVQAYGQRDALKLLPVDANETLTEVVQAMAETLGRDVEIDVLYNVSPALVRADVVLLHHVITALVANARDAMPAGGTLTLATTLVAVPAESPERYAVPAGRYIVLTVADTGMGMSAEKRQHMFEPFYSTKVQHGHGAGLGLASVEGIVREHGWTITVETEPEVGTAISIYMPEAPEQTSDAPGGTDQPTFETAPARNT